MMVKRMSSCLSVYMIVLACILGASATLTAKKKDKRRCEKVCIKCSKVNRSGRKVKEGFVNIPARLADDGSPIPSANLFFREQGCGKEGQPTLVFIHGNAFSSTMWRCQQEEFSKDFRTIAFDLRGFGFSDTTDPTQIAYNTELFADDINVALQELGITDPIWVGHSLGGGVGLFYTQRYPGELVKLSMTATSLFLLVPDSFVEPGCDPTCPTEVNPNSPTCWPFPTFTETQFAGLAALIEQIGLEAVLRNVLAPLFYNEACQDELADAIDSFVETGLQEGVGVIASTVINFDDLRPFLGKVDVPTQIMFGGIDAVVPRGNSLFAYDNSSEAGAIPGAFLSSFDDKGHVPMVTDFKRYNCKLRDFITGESSECCVCPLVKPTSTSKKG